jgi:hypothetical protein
MTYAGPKRDPCITAPEDRHVHVALPQRIDDVAPDKAGATGDECPRRHQK